MIAMDGYNLIITNSLFAHNASNTNCAIANNVVVFYADLPNCPPRQQFYNTLIANSTVFGDDYQCRGIYMMMAQSSYMVDIVLDSVVVYGSSGDNIYILTTIDNVVPYSLTVNNSISSNSCGFGLSVVDNFFHSIELCTSIPSSNLDLIIVIANSSFTYNNRGINIHFIGTDFSPRVKIYSTEISHNTGLSGIVLVSYTYHQSQFYVTLQNVIVNNNTYLSNLQSPENGLNQSSAVQAEFVTALVLNNVSITNNNMTGLTLYNSAVILNSNSTSIVHNNTGIDGGGLAMYGNSYLVFQEYSLLNFTNNKAKHRGGAMFVDKSTQYVNYACFFQYSSHIPKLQSAKAFLSGNKADIAGSVLFGGEIDTCSSFFVNEFGSHNYFDKIFHYSAQTGPSVISSEPTHVRFCDDNNTIKYYQTRLTMTAYPGEEINISVVTVGQENGVAPGIVEIKQSRDGIVLEFTGLYNTSAMNCTVIQFTLIDKIYRLTVFNQKYIYSEIMLIIAMYDCPLGFQLSNETKSCDCSDKLKAENVKCNAATKTITRQGNIWIGNISDCVVELSPCPLDYCHESRKVNFSFTDPDPQCALNRTGMLCGGCKQNFSLALGSNNCIPCHEFSYLALIIPFAAAGFGLVALLMVLNLTVSIGTINGLIFYASIVKISESTGIFFPNGSILVLSQFIAWLNLDLGIETCFYPGMTAYAKVWLQFVFPLYIWFIIATIIVLCRYSTWLSNKIGGNVVQVLATLILLSFTKIFRTFAPALTWITLPCENNTTVWYVDGNVPYFSLKHYILIAAAGLFLLLAVPYTLALLFDAVIEKYLTRISFFRRQWIKFKPFVDAYHGPYKDNCRFWTGLLLLVRMSFTLVSLHLDTFGTLIFITASTTVLLSLLVNFEGVYQKKYLNSLECLSYLNLGLLSALAAVYQNNGYNEEVVTIISVSVALATFIGVLLFHVHLRVKNNYHWFKKCAVKSDSSIEESERLLEDDVYMHHVQPTTTDINSYMKRESLIEFSS